VGPTVEVNGVSPGIGARAEPGIGTSDTSADACVIDAGPGVCGSDVSPSVGLGSGEDARGGSMDAGLGAGIGGALLAFNLLFFEALP
jgi:hypothetical protein